MACRIALLSEGRQQGAVLGEKGLGQRHIDLSGGAVEVGHAHQLKVFRVIGQQLFHGLYLRVGGGHQQRLAGDVAGQGQVRRFVAVPLQVGKRLLLFNQPLVAA
ncbi:hypothetical protein D3C84_867860 [compost metagenome]